MKPPFTESLKFVLASEALTKNGHARERPFKRHSFDDRIPRTTTCAARERISQTTIGSGLHFPQTVATDRQVAGDFGSDRTLRRSFDNPEHRTAGDCDRFTFHAGDFGHLWQRIEKLIFEIVDPIG
jgi:hypothetical protein